MRDLSIRCFRANGCDVANAEAVADVIHNAERDGAKSHGLFRVPGYIKSLKSGKANGHAVPVLEDLAPAVLRVKGDGGFAPLAQQLGHEPLVERARSQGVAALAITNIHHFQALWYEVEPLAEAGLCAFAFTAAFPYVVHPGGAHADLRHQPDVLRLAAAGQAADGVRPGLLRLGAGRDHDRRPRRPRRAAGHRYRRER